VNDFFENELQFLTEYHGHLREAAIRTEKMTQRHKDVGDSHQKISNALTQLSTTEKGNVETFVAKTAEIFERIKVGVSEFLLLFNNKTFYSQHSIESGDPSGQRSGPQAGRHLALLSAR